MSEQLDCGAPQELDRAECLSLLSGCSFGRIGITSKALPAVLPVNYRLIGDDIVFRTGAGTKLAAATSNAVVAFEVDQVDPVAHSGWSVMAIGEARRVTDEREMAELAAAEIPHWASTESDTIVVVPTTMLTGRRIGLR